MKKFKSVFIVMFTSQLIRTQHLPITWKVEALFQLFLLYTHVILQLWSAIF